MPTDNPYVWKWLFNTANGEVVRLPARPADDGWIVNLRPGCPRSKLLEFVPAGKVFDTREDAERLGGGGPLDG